MSLVSDELSLEGKIAENFSRDVIIVSFLPSNWMFFQKVHSSCNKVPFRE